MKLAFFSVPALSSDDAEDEVNRFLAAHRIVAVDRQLVASPSGAYWALCVSYLPREGGQPRRKSRVDYKEVLSAPDFAVFARLRTLRKEIAEREGVPAYALFTNEQLAAIVTRRVGSTADLAELAGVGPARIEKYAKPFLDLLRQLNEEREGGHG